METMKVEAAIKVALAAILAGLTALVGNVSTSVLVFLGLIVLDYATGFARAAIRGQVSSARGAKGLLKKFMIFFAVMLAHAVDLIAGTGTLVRDAAVYFYAINEVVSIIENVGDAGLPLPPALTKIVATLQKGKISR